MRPFPHGEPIHGASFLLGQMSSSLKHHSSELAKLGRELEKQKATQHDLKERIEMIDQRWRSLLAFAAALIMIVANVIDKEGLKLLSEAVGLLK